MKSSTMISTRSANVSTKRKKLIVFTLVLVFSAWSIYNFSSYIDVPLYVFVNKDVKGECVIPNLDPFDPRIMTYYNWHPPPLNCDKTPSLMFVDPQGFLRYNDSVFSNISSNTRIACTYSIVKLIDDFHVEFEKEISFKPPIMIRSDVFIVKCRDVSSNIVYENLHHKVSRLDTLKDRRDIRNESADDLSVVIFGVDSLSRLAAYRKLPKTVAYLRDEMKAYIFKGYNKMGDHTFPNLVGLFTGETPNKIASVNLNNDPADKFPLVWKNYSKNGYVKMFAEDWPEIATFNQVMPKGFSEPPAEHYMRPFFLAMRKIKPMQYRLGLVLQFLESNAVRLKKTSALCYGNRPNHMLVIDYYKQFLQTYRGKAKFSFGWLNELGHNFVNFFELGDKDFVEFLKWMQNGKYLKNTVLIFFSDHGSRLDTIRNTYVGRIEDRMPFLSMVVPEKFKARYPHIAKNLEANTKKLTCTYDLHETLKDIVNKRFMEEDLRLPPSALKTSVSIGLFRDIPSSRSCWQARIPEHYCACFSSVPLNTTSAKAKEIAEFVVAEINEKLRPVKDKCAILILNKIGNAEILSDNLQRKAKEEHFNIWKYIFSPEENSNVDYRVTIETIPGNGLFEATLKYHGNTDSYEISDDISRINTFGNQTRCMKNRLIRDYCYCL